MVSLEKPNGDKTEIWRALITPDGITIQYGKRHRLRTINIPLSSCEDGPKARLTELIAQRLEDGYHYVSGNDADGVLAYTANQKTKKALEQIQTSHSMW